MKNKALYKKAVEDYLKEQLNLETYDQEMKDSPLDFVPGDIGDNSIGLQYFYFKNDIHDERLSKEDQELIDSFDEMSDEIMDAAVRTFAKTIPSREITCEEDKKIRTFYDDSVFRKPDFVTVDTLVVGIKTACAYDEAGNFIDRNHEIVKETALKDIAEQMEKELEGSLGDTPIRVIADPAW
ncbi:MAG: hypothetical protein K6G61_09910 [Solobacterium sp.]|nr:hypothetical protein [Solobacterium sp.]